VHPAGLLHHAERDDPRHRAPQRLDAGIARSCGGGNLSRVLRILAGILGLSLTAFALLIARTQLRGGFDPMGAIFGLGTAAAALFCWWFAFRALGGWLYLRLRGR
jgi:hypothetical protein